MSKYIPGEGVMEFLMSDKHKFDPLMDGERAIIQSEFCGTVRSEVVKGPLCRDCGLTEEMHTQVLAKLLTLPAAADSRQPCEVRRNNSDLFECLLQGLMRELDRLYWNHNQRYFYDSPDVHDCWEWWPGGLKSFKFGRLELEFLPDDDGGYVRLTCGGHAFMVEVSGKRIGMYGPDIVLSDYEWVDWFNRSMKDIGS